MNVQENDEVSIGEVPISNLLTEPLALVPASLLMLTGDASLAEPHFKSGLAARVAEAWTTPLPDLTGAQVRTLVGQRFGLRWLAQPVAEVLQRHPRAECDLYPGDLMCAALRAYDDFLRFAPSEMLKVLSGDFEWMVQEFSFDSEGQLLREAIADLQRARAAVGES